jgi:ANTAR domain
MEARGVSEEDAYQLLRSKAMLKREQIETVAGAIVKARETLSFEPARPPLTVLSTCWPPCGRTRNT